MKKIVRQEILNLRQTMKPEEITEKSCKIIDQLTSLDSLKNAKHIMLYISFRNEVDTKNLIEDLLKQNKRIFIPVTVPKTKEIIVSELKNPAEDLEIGTFGVLEPKKEALRPVSPDMIDFIIIPGVAFDKRGYRIGYGAGYYDRFLPKLRPEVPKISIAFQLQIVDQVENDSYDIPVDYIITEEGIITCQDQ